MELSFVLSKVKGEKVREGGEEGGGGRLGRRGLFGRLFLFKMFDFDLYSGDTIIEKQVQTGHI